MSHTFNESGKKISFDFGSSISYKRKKQLIDSAKQNGLVISYGLNKNVDFLIKDDETNLQTFKCRMAFKLNIPVLKADYLLNENHSRDLKDYLIKNKYCEDNFKRGKINSSSS